MSENNTYKGYHLRKTGSRVNELLSRQFIVPTLNDIPTSNTLTWKDGEYIVEFRVGELCRVSVNNKWEFYRLHDINDKIAYWEKANASELPDMSDYYTKDEVDDKISEHVPDLSDYYSKEEVDAKFEDHQPDLSEYYTKEETEQKISDSISSVVIPEDESIKNVTEDEYNAMLEADTLSDKTMYFVSKDGSPIALYIGKVQIAVREEGSKGFAYNFPIIF
jgi:hypothetical protein